jgi:hypothetical protein
MRTSLTYTHVEWHALLALISRAGEPDLTEADIPSRVTNAVGRSWLARQRETTVELTEADAAVFRALRATLPDADALAAIAEAERIIREHQRRRTSR